MKRKAREEKQRRAEKKARKAGPVNVVTIPDGPPSNGRPRPKGNNLFAAAFVAIFSNAQRKRKGNRGTR